MIDGHSPRISTEAPPPGNGEAFLQAAADAFRPCPSRNGLRSPAQVSEIRPHTDPAEEKRDGSSKSARAFWIVFGGFAQLLFLFTVVRLFAYLRAGGSFHGALAPRRIQGYRWVGVDGTLALQFAVLHSLLLWPPVRGFLGRVAPPALFGCIFCVSTCVSLGATMELWQASPNALWRLEGGAGHLVGAAFLLSWGALTYSLWLTGFGYQTGLTPWWNWVRGRRPAPRRFDPRGAYRYLRHPVYLSFLGLVWFNPVMTLDRAVLALIWTAHIFVGSHLKDRRLARLVGEPYRKYQERVPGYPFFPDGPLGRLPGEAGS
jgi:protein-S-isoprenylcysteine O-methyltransferase Ste14